MGDYDLTEQDEPMTLPRTAAAANFRDRMVVPEALQDRLREIAARYQEIHGADADPGPAPDPAEMRERERQWAQRFLKSIGIPWENRKPSWASMTDRLRDQGRGYCENLAQHLAAVEGFFVCGARGSLKTTLLALVAMAAGKQGVSVAYCPAGFVLVDKFRAAVRRDERRRQYDDTDLQSGDLPYADADLLLLDDLDYVSTDGYDAELRSYDAIGQFLYLRYAAGQTVC